MKTVEVLNNHFLLYPQKAIYWQEQNTLIISDPHFGKSDTFRGFGIPVPEGTTDSNFQRLNYLINESQSKSLIILGDLIHSKKSKSESLRKKVNKWRKRNDKINLILINGNHDKAAGEPLDEFKFNQIVDEIHIEHFVLTHKPQHIDGKYVLAGHVHPSIALEDFGRQKRTFPCFYFGEKQAILPAFGDYTGNYNIHPKSDNKIFIIAEDDIFELSNLESQFNKL